MTQVHYHMPPELAERTAGRSADPCEVCLMFAKGDQVTASRPTWQPLVNDGKDAEQEWIAYRATTVIFEGVTWGIFDQFPGLRMWLCWTHLGAIAPPVPGKPCSWCDGTGRAKGIEAAKGSLPPGLANGGKRGRG